MKNALLLLISTVATVFTLEFIVRAIAPQQLVDLNRAEVWRADADLGHRNWHDVNLQVNVGERPVTWATDKNGYRIDPNVTGKTSEDPEIRGLVVGDSFVAALQVDYEDTFAAILEKQLSQRLNKRVKIDNTAVDGYGPMHYLIQTRKVLAKQSYDFAVVSIFIGNDITKKYMIPSKPITNKKTLRLPKSLDFHDIKEAIIFPINERLESISHLHVLFKNATRALQDKFELGQSRVRKVFLGTMDKSEAMEFTLNTLLELRDVFLAHSLPVLFSIAPAKEQVELEWGYAMYAINGIDRTDIDFDGITNQLVDRLRQRGIQVLNLLPSMRRAYEEKRIKSHGDVNGHFSPTGHRIASELLFPPVHELVETGIASWDHVRRGNYSQGSYSSDLGRQGPQND